MQISKRQYLWVGLLVLILSAAFLWVLTVNHSRSELHGLAQLESKTAYFLQMLETEPVITANMKAQLSGFLSKLRDGAVETDFNGQKQLIPALREPVLRARLSDVEAALSTKTDENIRAAYLPFAQLSAQTYSDTIDKLERERVLLKAAIVLALLALVIWSCWRQFLTERLARVAWTKSQSLLSANSDGALVLDQDGVVVAQNAQVTHRNILPGICIGSHFSNFLAPMIEDQALQTVKDSVFALLEQGSPKDAGSRARSIIVKMNSSSSKKPTQHLLFKMSMCQWASVQATKESAHVFLVVSNVDEHIETQRTLEAAMRLQQSRPSQVVDAFHVPPSELRRYLSRSKKSEHELRRILSGKEKAISNSSDPLLAIGLIVKSALADAQAVKLALFIDAWSDFLAIQQQNKVKKMLGDRVQMRMLVKLDDIKMIRVLLEGMIPMMTAAHSYRRQFGDLGDDARDFCSIDQMSHDLVDAYASFSESVSVEAASSQQLNRGAKETNSLTIKALEEELEPGTYLMDHFTVLAQSVAAHEDKNIEVFFKGLDSMDSSHQYFRLFSEVGDELLRNSIEHGLEIELNRILSHKEKVGRIDVELSESDGRLCLSVRDDGRGLDFVGIRKAAVQDGLIGSADKDVSRATLLRCIFTKKLSTLESQGERRGVGLSRVKALVKAVGGKVSVRSVDGQYCQFKVKLPKV